MRVIKKVALIVFLGLVNLYASAQGEYIKNRLNFKLGHSTTPEFFNHQFINFLGNFRIEANYGVNSYIEIGGYIGYSRFGNVQHTGVFDPETSLELVGFTTSNALFYGVNANFHLLPFILKDNSSEPRMDVYLSGKLGAINMFAPEGSTYKGQKLDYGLYGGYSFYITKRLGVFIEYGLNRKVNQKKLEPCLRYGVTLKF